MAKMHAYQSEYIRNLQTNIRFSNMSSNVLLMKYTNPTILIRNHNTFRDIISKNPGMINVPFNLEANPHAINYASPEELTSWFPLHNRVSIKDLTTSIDATMFGKYFLCRTIAEPLFYQSLDSVVEDPEGVNAVRLAIYNFSKDPNVLPKGTILIVKNPFFKNTVDGGLTLRSDDPTIVYLVHSADLQEAFPLLKWNEAKDENGVMAQALDSSTNLSPTCEKLSETLQDLSVEQSKPHQIPVEKEPKKRKDYLQIAMDFLADKNPQGALNALNKGLQSSPDDQTLRETRIDVYLSLQMFSKALKDTEAMKFPRNPVKLLYATMEALCGLKNYDELVHFIECKLEEEYLDRGELAKLGQLLTKIKQQLRGDYDMLEFMSKRRDSLPYYVEYTGPVEITDVGAKGRGLVAALPIKAGQLVLASKAIDLYTQGPDQQENLQTPFHLEQLSQKVTEHVKDPDVKREVYHLYASSTIPYLAKDGVGNKKKVNKERVSAICNSNFFLANAADKIYGVGLFNMPSYFNHNCIDANCSWVFLGNFLFVRAYKDIAEGQELIISYTKVNHFYEKRTQLLNLRGFVCDCRLCSYERNEHPAVRIQRVQIVSEMEKLLSTKEGILTHLLYTKELREAVRAMEATREDQPDLNFLAVDLKAHLALRYFAAQEHQNSFDHLTECYMILKDSPFQDHVCLLLTRILAVVVGIKDNSLTTTWTKTLEKHLITTYGETNCLRVINPDVWSLFQLFNSKGNITSNLTF